MKWSRWAVLTAILMLVAAIVVWQYDTQEVIADGTGKTYYLTHTPTCGEEGTPHCGDCCGGDGSCNTQEVKWQVKMDTYENKAYLWWCALTTGCPNSDYTVSFAAITVCDCNPVEYPDHHEGSIIVDGQTIPGDTSPIRWDGQGTANYEQGGLYSYWVYQCFVDAHAMGHQVKLQVKPIIKHTGCGECLPESYDNGWVSVYPTDIWWYGTPGNTPDYDGS